ncbi:hypothetical protein [Parahaliea mediterranea]|uniref:hypothetical protein n=1 Tax=Parahaliea mediterranea TaxID=651086 RepID=UPI000E2EF04A|nr:hypothetical protein [Parahaliea mediterranea]
MPAPALSLLNLNRQLALAVLLLQCVVVWSSPAAWQAEGGNSVAVADHSPPFLLGGQDGQPATAPPPRPATDGRAMYAPALVQPGYAGPSLTRQSVTRYPACPQAPPVPV